MQADPRVTTELLRLGYKGQAWVTIHEPRWLLPPNMTSTNWDQFPAQTQHLAQVAQRCMPLHSSLVRTQGLTAPLWADTAARAGAPVHHSATRGHRSCQQAGAHWHPEGSQLVCALLCSWLTLTRGQSMPHVQT